MEVGEVRGEEKREDTVVIPRGKVVPKNDCGGQTEAVG